MGRVLTEATIESLRDLWDAERGQFPANQVRRVVVSDALVDTGASVLSLPTATIQQLGLRPTFIRRFRSAIGPGQAQMFDPVRLTIQGRSCSVDVMEVPDGTPVLIGQIPLEQLDFVVDPKNQSLIGNPAHGGEQVMDLF